MINLLMGASLLALAKSIYHTILFWSGGDIVYERGQRVSRILFLTTLI